MFNAEEIKNRIAKYVVDGTFKQVPAEIAEELRLAWKASDLTQVEFAKLVGLNANQISYQFSQKKPARKRSRLKIEASDIKQVAVAEPWRKKSELIVIQLAGGHRVELNEIGDVIAVIRALC